MRIDLGDEPTGDWSQGYVLLQTLVFVEEMGIHIEIERRREDGTPTQEMFEHFGLPAFSDPCRAEFLQIYTSPWWTRTWTLQEVVVGREANLFTGIFKVPWPILRMATGVFLELRVDSLLNFLGDLTTRMGFLNREKITNLRRWNARPRSNTSPLYALMEATDFEVSNPKDKIIGLLPLIDEEPTGGILPFLPDYSLSVKTLYHRFSVHLVSLGLGQPLLDLSGLHRRRILSEDDPEAAASWVVDWMAQSKKEFIEPFSGFRFVSFQASGSTVFQSSLAALGDGLDPDSMIVDASAPDTIKAVTNALHTENTGAGDQGERFRTILNWVRDAEGLKTKSKSTGPYPNIADAFARTLLLGDAYVHGVMGGEAMSGTFETTQLWIR